ncbi:MAG: MATE family efflux transporter, partial [Thermosphaera sp.]|nr:MATE family efflux transporter [Thermosphaera sp.]
MNFKSEEATAETLLARALKTTIPLVLVETVSSLYSLADTYFVSGLGEEALAGVGVAGYILWLYTVVFALFQTPLMILVSQS